MPLLSVLSVRIRPEKIQEHEALVAEIAQRARDAGETFHWTAHQVMMGDLQTLYFSSVSEDFNALSQRGQAPEMVTRLLGEKQAQKTESAINACTQEVRLSVFTERADLSYQPDQAVQNSPISASTTIRARNGEFEACEELLRKLAEAIPKVGDPARIVTWQPVIGDLAVYVAVRPLQDLADLDKQMSPPELLSAAFGPAEGGLIYRAGLNAIESATRDIVILRPDLSNPK
ncbi:MAG: hypothetical protein IH881_08110 [Myxococcales bacterium]|nr:hypothetical protein [Myxococcales bacterium]